MSGALRRGARALLAGLGWLVVLFVIDSFDSYMLIKRSTQRIKTDKVTRELIEGSVVDYVSRIGLTYVVMGVLAGVLLHLALRVWFPREPRRRQWWAAAAELATATTLLATLRQLVSFPPLYDTFAFTRQLAENLWPWTVDALGGLALAVLAVLAWRRWRAAGARGFGRRVLALAVVVAILVGVFRNPAPAPLSANRGPNLVLIGVDALRPDHLGYHGYERDTAPHIDALLRESVVFRSTWTPLPRTYPAWTSTLSGTLPITSGIRDNLPEPEALVPDVPLLPQLMARLGWTTAFATDDSRFSYMVPEVGWQHILQPPVNPTNFAVSVNEPRYRAFHGLMHNPVGFAVVPTAAYNQAFGKSYRPWLFADRAQDLLAQVSRSERFFYAIHSCVLHAPGDRAYPWYRMYGQNGYRGSNRFHYSRSGTEILVESEDTGLPVNVVAEQDVRIYDSGIDMANRLVGQLVDALREAGLLENTVVVLFSDHGEETWAADLPYKYTGPNHGFHPFGDAQFRVELAIRFPDGSHAGETVDAPVRLVDLAPTLAEYFEIEWPGTFDGRSALPLVRGEPDPEPRVVYMETGLSEPRYWVPDHVDYPFKNVSQRYRVDPETRRIHIRPEFRPYLVAAKDRVLQVGRWKLAWFPLKSGSRVALFDREADPLNRHDLSLSYPGKTAELGLLLLPYLERDGISEAAAERWRALVSTAQPDSGGR